MALKKYILRCVFFFFFCAERSFHTLEHSNEEKKKEKKWSGKYLWISSMIVKVAGGDVGVGGLIVTFKSLKEKKNNNNLFHVNKISKFWVIDLYEMYMKKKEQKKCYNMMARINKYVRR